MTPRNRQRLSILLPILIPLLLFVAMVVWAKAGEWQARRQFRRIVGCADSGSISTFDFPPLVAATGHELSSDDLRAVQAWLRPARVPSRAPSLWFRGVLTLRCPSGQTVYIQFTAGKYVLVRLPGNGRAEAYLQTQEEFARVFPHLMPPDPDDIQTSWEMDLLNDETAIPNQEVP